MFMCRWHRQSSEHFRFETKYLLVGLGGLGVSCSPRDPRFADSNPVEVDGFFQGIKILSTSPPGGTLSWGGPESEISGSLKNLKPEKNSPLRKI